MQLYRNRNEQLPEMQAPQQSFPMPQTMPANMEQMPEMMPMEQMPTNQMPQMMPMNHMPMNQMPQMMPMEQMPVNQMPQMMPEYMPMCPYVMPNMNPYMAPGMMPQMMPQMNGMMPSEMDDNMMEDVMGAEENDYMPNNMFGTDNRQRQPILSNNPITIQIRMRKEQTAYNNYGNPSGNADILYTGTRGTWTFNVPPGVNIPFNRPAQLVVRAVLDDHANVPVRNYSARIIVNNVTVHNGPLNLQHGRPAGQQFTNWTNLTFNISNLRRNNSITIINTSRAGDDDWIALDWMEVNINR